MDRYHHIDFQKVSQASAADYAGRMIEARKAERLLREAGIDPRGWLNRTVSHGMVNFGELLVRLGEGLVDTYENASTCDDGDFAADCTGAIA